MAMEKLINGFQDMRAVLEKSHDGYRRGGDVWPSWLQGSAVNPPTRPKETSKQISEDFATGWQRYCARNPRLRDPKALPLLVRQGVPQDLRCEVWSHCLGLPTPSAGSTAAAQEAVGTSDTEELPASILDVIEADVARTFPNDKKFQESGGPESLRQVLIELAKQDKELGYCQSLNFIAANFLMVLSSQEMALAAVRQLIMKLQTRQWYTDGMRQLRGDTAVLEEMVRERLPAVHQVLTLHRFDFLFVTSKWFLCLFAATLTDEVLRRVWDVLLVDGIEAVFRISISLFALHQESILQVKSEDGLIHMMQDWQPDCSPEVLIQNAYSPSLIGSIGRLELDQRRKRAAEAISNADARAEMRATQLRRGGVRPASVLSRQ